MILNSVDNMTGQIAPAGWKHLGQVSLVMIICNHCPYVLFRMPAISKLVKDYRDHVHIVAVNSNDASPTTDDSNPEDGPEFMPAFSEKWDLQCDYIFDEDQSIAHSFNAVCTPEFYVIDKDGMIVYHGELDASHTSNDLMPTGSSLRHALDVTLVSKPITWEPNPSFGCSIKWKPKPAKLCVYAWKGLQISPNGDVNMCCFQQGNAAGSIGNLDDGAITISEVRRSDKWNDIRQSMLDGEQAPACEKCWKIENDGFYSGRQYINDKYPESLADITSAELKDDILHHVDIRQSNICNMKCLSCNGDFSSLWAVEEAKEYHWPKTNGVKEIDNDDIHDYLFDNINNIKEFYFAGGEPLMNKVHWDIMAELDRQERYDVKIVYNTNGLKLNYKGKHIFDYWDKFTNWHAGVSIDAIGARSEYVRSGTVWSKLDSNINMLCERYNKPHTNQTFGLDCTVSALNASGMMEFFDYINDHNIDRFVWTNYVYSPSYLHVSILPRYYREKLVKELEDYFSAGVKIGQKSVLNEDGLSFYRNQMLNNEIATSEDKQRFKDFILHKDNVRGTNIFDSCPEFKDIWDDIK